MNESVFDPREGALIVSSPIGPLRLVSRDGAIERLEFAYGGAAGAGLIAEADVDARASPIDARPLLSEAADQLGAYFAGSLRSFSLPLRPAGTAFFRAVWDELARVPYGGLSTYGELASRLGNPGAARAVGMALNRNPIAIIIPCHRVIGSNARLVGYAGGLDRKRFLIELESRASFGA